MSGNEANKGGEAAWPCFYVAEGSMYVQLAYGGPQRRTEHNSYE
jgi:hypothetical protein